MKNYSRYMEFTAPLLTRNVSYGLIGILSMILLSFPYLLQAQNAVRGAEFIIEPPTLENLGFEWYIEGDDNRNSTVKVEYRLAGTNNDWIEGMPLLREAVRK